jgi:hypothetical protein
MWYAVVREIPTRLQNSDSLKVAFSVVSLLGSVLTFASIDFAVPSNC